MGKIKVTELFRAIQGEGRYVGVPSIFLRTFGCNFQCAGFSMPRGHLSDERLKIDPSKYSRLEDLPLVHTGCDSYPAWDHRFKHLSPFMEISEIVDKVQSLLPNGLFDDNKHLVITGGEPLLGWQKQYIELFEEFDKRDMGLNHITFETNGTQKIRADLAKVLSDYSTTFSISSKLPSSGEHWEDAIKPEVVAEYADKVNDSYCYFKWVVSSKDDIDDIRRVLKVYQDDDIMFPVYLMAAGGTSKYYNQNKKWVADICLENGWRYSPRLHLDLFGNAWGT